MTKTIIVVVDGVEVTQLDVQSVSFEASQISSDSISDPKDIIRLHVKSITRNQMRALHGFDQIGKGE